MHAVRRGSVVSEQRTAEASVRLSSWSGPHQHCGRQGQDCTCTAGHMRRWSSCQQADIMHNIRCEAQYRIHMPCQPSSCRQLGFDQQSPARALRVRKKHLRKGRQAKAYFLREPLREIGLQNLFENQLPAAFYRSDRTSGPLTHDGHGGREGRCQGGDCGALRQGDC
jgi:hypothetical protein